MAKTSTKGPRGGARPASSSSRSASKRNITKAQVSRIGIRGTGALRTYNSRARRGIV